MKIKHYLLFLISTLVVFQASSQIAANYEVGTWKDFKTAAVSYTFDDNLPGQQSTALPLFDKYGYKITFFAVTTGAAGANPNWANLKKASDNGHDVSSHSVSHPQNLATAANEENEYSSSKNTIIQNVPSTKCQTIAYPNCNIGTISLMQKYFIAGRVCDGQIINKSPSDFWRLGSIITGNTGSVNTESAWNARVTSAKSSGGWCVFLTHAIDNESGYSPTSSSELSKHLTFMNTNKADYWVGTFTQVVKYIKERNALNLTEVAITADSLRITPTDNLDNTIYDASLTIRRKLPANWTEAKVYQGTTLVTSSIVTISNVKYVVFDIVPDKGVYTLSNKASGSTGCATTAPAVTSPLSYTQNSTAPALTANGTSLKWYGTSATGGTASSTAPTPSTSTVGTMTYYVSQTLNSCEGPRASIVVTVSASTGGTSTILGKCKGKYLGNIIAGSVPNTYTTYWNQATSENASKWGSVEGTQGSYNWSGSDLAYNWAKNNGGIFKYHCFVWGQQAPGWVANASVATIQAAVANYIKACSTHYALIGGLKMIDVVNEPVNTAFSANYKAALTAGYKAEPANAGDLNNQYGWVIWPFQLARKYFPDAQLLINEYNIEHNWNNCRTPYMAMANAVKNAPNLTDGKKNLIDGVGLQCHSVDGITPAVFKACIDEIWTKTRVPIHITEFDVEATPNEAAQQKIFSDLIPVAWEHEHVAGITFWGYIQGTTWRNGNGTAGPNGTDTGILYSSSYSSKPLGDRPAMTWLKSYFASKPNLSCCPAPAPFASCTVTEIDEDMSNVNEEVLLAYPNPFVNYFTVNATGVFEYILLNVSGEILSSGTSENKLELGNGLAQGIYFLKIKQDGTTKVVKICKN